MKRVVYTLLSSVACAMLFLTAIEGNSCCVADLCCGGPLCCGAVSVMAKGGVTPSSYSNRGQIWVNTGTIVSLSSVPKFRNQFDLPWNAGAEIALNLSNRVQVFLEYARTEANGRTHRYTTTLGSFSEATSNYEVNAGYLGARFYFDSLCGCCCCNSRVAPYAGFKAGCAVQKRVLYNLRFNNGATVATNPYWQDQAAASVGAQIGMEWWVCNGISIALQGEFVGTQGLRPNHNIVLSPAVGGISNINIGDTRWILSWPATLGIRYTF